MDLTVEEAVDHELGLDLRDESEEIVRGIEPIEEACHFFSQQRVDLSLKVM